MSAPAQHATEDAQAIRIVRIASTGGGFAFFLVLNSLYSLIFQEDIQHSWIFDNNPTWQSTATNNILTDLMAFCLFTWLALHIVFVKSPHVLRSATGVKNIAKICVGILTIVGCLGGTYGAIAGGWSLALEKFVQFAWISIIVSTSFLAVLGIIAAIAYALYKLCTRITLH